MKQLMKGNYAMAEAAIRAGCRMFAGYPITPQTEILEYVVLCIITVLAFAAAMYALRGVYYATMGEAGVPIAMTGTATGIISVIGYLPDTFMNLLIGNKLDKYPGAAGYKYIFIYMIVFAALGIAVASVIKKIGKKNAAKAENKPEDKPAETSAQ